MKTIKELADITGVSKVSIYNALKRPEFKNHIFKNEKKVTLIDELAEELLKNLFIKSKDETINDILSDDETMNTFNEPFNEEIVVKTNDIISILEKQVREKDEQINNLLKIVLNQQQIQGVQILNANKDVINAKNEVDNEEPKKGFWKRAFGK